MTGRLVAAAAAIAAGAGCGPSGDPLGVRYAFWGGPEQACEQANGDPILDCNDVPMACAGVVLLRVVDPDDPSIVYDDHCVVLDQLGATDNLCSLERAALGSETPFPTTRVEIQLAIYKLTDVDADGDGKDFECPSQVDFTATGFAAVTNQPQPALAGTAYATGYDDEVTIYLGCNDLGRLDTEECKNEDTIAATATVYDFDLQASVSREVAETLTVNAAEPTEQSSGWQVVQPDVTKLELVSGTTDPQWHIAVVDPPPSRYACAQVFGQNTGPTLACQSMPTSTPDELSLQGSRVEPDTIDRVVAAAGLPDVPEAGLVLGIVVDTRNGAPIEGIEVRDTAGSTVQYLSADGTAVGGTVTSSSGMFLSTDAPFEAEQVPNPVANRWTVTNTGLQQVTIPIGGLVANHLSVMVIELNLQTK